MLQEISNEFWLRVWLCYSVLFLACTAVLAGEAGPIPSYRKLRYEGVVGQTDWYTCGPAAVATLLTYYYGIHTTETEALELAEGFMREMGIEPGPKQGINALALKKTLAVVVGRNPLLANPNR